MNRRPYSRGSPTELAPDRFMYGSLGTAGKSKKLLCASSGMSISRLHRPTPKRAGVGGLRNLCSCPAIARRSKVHLNHRLIDTFNLTSILPFD